MDWKRIPRLAIYPAFFAALLNPSALRAAPLETWQGARADVYASGVQSSRQGSVAEASATGNTRIYYTSDNAGLEPNAYSVEARSSAKAEALGTRDALLRVGISQQVDDPGTRPMFGNSNPEARATAEASWIGDRIHLVSGPNGALPDQVRLGVMLELRNPWLTDYRSPDMGAIDLKVGDRAIHLSGLRTDYSGQDISSRLVQLGFDTAEQTAPHSQVFRAKAFLDLAIDDQGWSDPFDLNLKAGAGSYLWSNLATSTQYDNLTLALDDLTLSDGTSVVDAGYGATFESGLEWPQPVPEPASVACWFALAGSAGWFSRKRARRTRGHATV